MPYSDLHKKKLKKNLADLGAILGLCALILIVTIIKLQGS